MSDDMQSDDTGTANTGTQAQQPSLTTPQQTEQTNSSAPTDVNQWDTDANPYRKRFNDTLSSAQRLYQEHAEFKKQYDGIDPNVARKLLEQQKALDESAKLKVWNKGHEKYSDFQTLRTRVNEYNRMRQVADTPEKQNMLKEIGGQMFSPEELTQVQEFDAARQHTMQSLTEDPQGFIEGLVQPLIQQALSQFDSFNRASQQTTQWFNDPNNQVLVDKYAPDMYRMMDPEVSPRDKAIEYARLKAENAALKASVGANLETTLSDQARGQVSAQITPRQPKPQVDTYQAAINKGFKPGTVEFGMELQRLNNKKG